MDERGGGSSAAEKGDASASLIEASPSSGNPDAFSSFRRTGTLWTAVAYIITAVIGSGVLSLPWSVAQLGWIGGPVAMLFFAGVTYIQTRLISECYHCSHTNHPPVTCPSYLDAVKHYLGEKSHLLCAVIVQLNLYGNGVVYTITTATSISAIRRLSGFSFGEAFGSGGDSGTSTYILLFGAAQLLLSQIPHFHNMTWLSIFAAAMSFSYSLICLALSVAKVAANGMIKGAVGGIAAASAPEKAWRISQAIGDIAFALPFSLVLLEIEDTLRSPPAVEKTMKKASLAAIVITTFFYISCGFFGYAAFGDATPGNLLGGAGLAPRWLVGVANAAVVLHLLGGYQVYSQPVYGHFDRWFAGRYPASFLATAEWEIKIPFAPGPVKILLLRVVFRTVYVVTTTALALWFPYFNQVIGVSGAFTFWPLTIHFPVEMYLAMDAVKPWSRRWLALRAFSGACLLVGGFAFVGSLEGVLTEKAAAAAAAA